MFAYQVGHNRARRIKVTDEEDTCFRRPGPPALWPSKRTTFRRKRDALRLLADLQAAGVKDRFVRASEVR
jgi:hypothetical protein